MLSWQGEQNAHFAWQVTPEMDYQLLTTIEGRSDVPFITASLVLYVDVKKQHVGTLNTALPHDLTIAFIKSPKIPFHAVEAAHQFMGARFDEEHIPKPALLTKKEIRGKKPKITIRLGMVSRKSGYSWQLDFSYFCADVTCFYNAIPVPLSVEKTTSHMHEQMLYTVHRHQSTEKNKQNSIR